MINKKRPPRDVIDKENYYMACALWASTRSKDPDTQVGAKIVSSAGKPLGVGYNGPPKEILDSDVDWSRPEKYPFIIHAEKNAIKHSDPMKLIGASIYITGRPCKNCMIDIVDSGILRVIYFERKCVDESSMLHNQLEWDVVQDIAKKSRLSLSKFSGNLNWMKDQIWKFEELGYFD